MNRVCTFDKVKFKTSDNVNIFEFNKIVQI